jgi:YhcH/YjgK/YiaL family protein
VIQGFLNDTDEAAERDPRLAPGFEFLRNMKPGLAVGKHEIGGGGFAIVSEYQTSEPEDKKLEAHRKYIDIQYLVSGEEAIDVCPLGGLRTAVKYDMDKDIVFFHDPDSIGGIILQAGSFAVFYPEDAHRPGLTMEEGPAPVRKVVVKIPVEEKAAG